MKTTVHPRVVQQLQDWLIVDKPALTLSVPSRLGVDDPRGCLGVELQRALGRQIFPVHRLDFEVSGVMLFALNPEAQRQGARWFESRMIAKEYEAVTKVSGRNVGDKGEIRQQLRRGKRRAYESPHGEWAETAWHLRERNPTQGWDFWSLWPRTGRSHQLRVAMASLGAPILGDELYGGRKMDWKVGIALRARSLGLERIPESERLGLPERIEVVSLLTSTGTGS